MLQIEEARECLIQHINWESQVKTVPLMKSLGQVLADDIAAGRDQPPFPRSPLDGYAVRGEDVAEATSDRPVRLNVVGNIYAGEVYGDSVAAGQAVRLTTGAPIPDGANAVIRQEDTDLGMDQVAIYKPVKPFQNYCYQGEDYKAGDVLLVKGTYINAGALSVLSSLGKESVTVMTDPQIAVISTGDEVIAPGEAWKPGKIYDSNRAYVTARLAELGIPAAVSIHAGDVAREVADIIADAAKTCSFIITTGGVSVGEKDILHEVVALLDADLLFWKVRIKPGSPTLAFRYGDTLVLCLSGNPYGAIANFELLARPVLYALTGKPACQMRTSQAILQNDFKKPAGARRFLRGYAEDGKVWINGSKQASGSISSMVNCNCMVEITPDMPGAATGESVKIYHLV